MTLIDANKLKSDILELFDSNPEIFNFKARVKLLCLIEEQPIKEKDQKTTSTPLNMEVDLDKINVDREIEMLQRKEEEEKKKSEALYRRLHNMILGIKED